MIYDNDITTVNNITKKMQELLKLTKIPKNKEKSDSNPERPKVILENLQRLPAESSKIDSFTLNRIYVALRRKFHSIATTDETHLEKPRLKKFLTQICAFPMPTCQIKF
eukprot:GHVP01012765.1.p1 GENE.GHVP01012765.1~~GHVP01012765.1.p1  ORF type:complete len:109 (+),score=18.14 GHVP01012765.1:1100-1426(+)